MDEWMEDAYAGQWDQDDLAEFSDNQAWEDSRADMEEDSYSDGY